MEDDGELRHSCGLNAQLGLERTKSGINFVPLETGSLVGFLGTQTQKNVSGARRGSDTWLQT